MKNDDQDDIFNFSFRLCLRIEKKNKSIYAIEICDIIIRNSFLGLA